VPVPNRIAEFQDELTAWRRELHRYPELAYEERRTAEFVAGKLRAFGLDEVHTGIAGTGVVGVLRGREPGPAIALRADMDALPIEEASGVPWASTVPGRMHACGHDGHTTMLLGAARYLAETRNFAGTVCFVFQPAEEGAAGAKRMIEDGLFERFPVERVFGLHNWPWLPRGTFAVHSGPVMAAADQFDIVLRGRGCHGAMPHVGRDPVTAAAALVQALQVLVSRETDPLAPAVVTVGSIRAGEAYNVVPDRATLTGTVRALDEEVRARIERRIGEMAQHVAAAFGVEAEVDYRLGYPPTVNDAEQAEVAARAAAAVAGEQAVRRDLPPCMGAEDFAFMMQKKPGAYIWLGTGTAEEGRILHSPLYDFDDASIPFGVGWWAAVVDACLGAARSG